MNQLNATFQPDPMEDEINLIDLVYPIYKHRKFLLIFCLFVTAITAVITIIMPKTYEATAVILPEVKESGGSELKAALLQQFGGLAGLVGGGAPTSTASIKSILTSKELASVVSKRYNYAFIMGIDDKKEEMAIDLNVQMPKNEPTISVGIQSNDPLLAADLANTYLKELDVFNRTSNISSARRLRKYIETRLEDANRNLSKVQEDLRDFQEKNRAVSISKQAEATLEILSKMEAQKVELEVEKAATEQFFKGQHIEIEQIKAKMEALQKNIDRLTYSNEPEVGIEQEKGKLEFYIPLILIPALNFDESRLLLQVKVKTGVVTMLTTQLEQTKLDEAKDMTTIHVLDWAKVPEKPIKPKLKLTVILSAVVSLFMGIFLVFFIEFISKMDEDPETGPKFQEMKKGIKDHVYFWNKLVTKWRRYIERIRSKE